jgi:hypothetical protein
MCVQELNQIFGDSDRPATFADTLEMKILERCLLEALRMYPPVPIIARKLQEDITLGIEQILDPTMFPKNDSTKTPMLFRVFFREFLSYFLLHNLQFSLTGLLSSASTVISFPATLFYNVFFTCILISFCFHSVTSGFFPFLFA